MPSTKSVTDLSVGRGDLVLPYSVIQDVNTLRQRVVSVNNSFEEISYHPSPGCILSTTYWEYYATNECYRQTSIASDSTDILLPGLPVGTMVRSITATVIGAGGHAGLPASMPRLYFQHTYSVPSGTFNWATVGTGDPDPSGTTGAYQAFHTITYANYYGDLIEADRVYSVILKGESGANSLTGLRCGGIRVQCFRV